MLDACFESIKGSSKIGSTLKGIGPAYVDKVGRSGLRIGDIFSTDFQTKYQKHRDSHLKILNAYNFQTEYLADGTKFTDYENLWFDGIEEIKKIKVIESEYYINNSLQENKSVLAEGAQGTMLDIDFGSYPYVTSSNTITAGACIGLGIAPSKIGEVYGVFKAYCTRVGSGPFPTELLDETGKEMQTIGREFGSTTGRPRRCGWLDLPALKYAIMLNGVTKLIMMKVDVLNGFEKINICTHYKYNNSITDNLPFDINTAEIIPVYKEFKGWKKDLKGVETFNNLPSELKDYISFIEENLNLPINIISIGPDRTETIIKS
jgi:adenylosuccinate synthase